PGVYQLNIENPGGSPRTLPFVVRRDPGESEMNWLSSEQRVALAEAGVQLDGGAPLTSNASPTASRPQPVWAALLAALPAVMLAELMLSGYLTRRRAYLSTEPVLEVQF